MTLKRFVSSGESAFDVEITPNAKVPPDPIGHDLNEVIGVEKTGVHDGKVSLYLGLNEAGKGFGTADEVGNGGGIGVTEGLREATGSFEEIFNERS